MEWKKLFICVCMLPVLAYSQDSFLPEITEFKPWEHIGVMETSPAGNYLGYSIYSDSSSTFSLRKTENLAMIRKISHAGKPLFLNEKILLYLDKNGFAHFENIEGGTIKEIKNITYYEPVLDNRFILLYSDYFSSEKPGTLTIVQTSNLKTYSLENISEVAISQEEKQVAYVKKVGGKSRLGIFDLNRFEETETLEATDNQFKYLNWGAKDEMVSFVEIDTADSFNTRIHFSSIEGGDRRAEVDRTHPDIPEKYIIHYDYMSIPRLSDDGRRLFFWIQKIADNNSVKDSDLEIWNSDDFYSQPLKEYFPPYSLYKKLVEWNIDSGELKMVSGNHDQEASLSPHENFLITTDNHQYLPAYLYKGNFSDVYITHLKNNKRFQILRKYPEQYAESLQFSPSGNHLIYFKDDNWWSYNLKAAKTILLTPCNNSALSYFKYPGVSLLYDNILWSKDEKNIVVTDEYDIWMIKTDGTGCKRLTGGREKGIIFRLDRDFYKRQRDFRGVSIDLETGLYLKARNPDTDERGYFRWKPSNGLEKLVYGGYHYNRLAPLPKKKGFIYVKEDFNHPPSIELKRAINNPEETIYTSNLTNSEPKLGTSKMVSYKSVNNEPLRAALFYPSDYQEGNKYPMIVSIYEDDSGDLHKFFFPDEFNAGLNPAFYTLNGYFVLQPQITYNRGSPGLSAYEDINAALDYMESTGLVAMDKVGLYGTSFGGYESVFIATQSDRFAAIAAGASITDLTSFYFNYSAVQSGPQFYSVEFNQFRMYKDFFEIKDQYLANSPIQNADNVTTPVFLWHGKKDTNVPWKQSLEFYLALCRMEMESRLVVFPDEGHIPLNKKNLFKLNRYLLDWFNQYLKRESKFVRENEN